MPFTVFFSWQSDRGTAEQALIERALNDAIQRIVCDATIERAVREEGIELDQDTKGMGGAPPIVDTIFSKIDRAAIFVADLTFVSKRANDRPAPNPNVLIEYGWALKSRTYNRLIPVMNTYYGEPTPQDMPFDMRHLKFPIQFRLPPDANDGLKKVVASAFSRELEDNMRAIINAPGFANGPDRQHFPGRDALSRFRLHGPIGKTYGSFGEPQRDVRLKYAPAYWLHVYPDWDSGRRWSTSELKQLATIPTVALWPPAAFGSTLSFTFVRGEDGFGVVVAGGPDDPTSTVVYIFDTGEVWGIDAFHAQVHGGIALPIEEFARALDQYRAFLVSKLKIQPPYNVEVGIDWIKDEKVWLPQRPGRVILQNPFGSCISNSIVHSATVDDEKS